MFQTKKFIKFRFNEAAEARVQVAECSATGMVYLRERERAVSADKLFAKLFLLARRGSLSLSSKSELGVRREREKVGFKTERQRLANNIINFN